MSLPDAPTALLMGDHSSRAMRTSYNTSYNTLFRSPSRRLDDVHIELLIMSLFTHNSAENEEAHIT
jgi:hypothetical protein